MTPLRSGPRVVRQWIGLLAGVLVSTVLASSFDIFWRADNAIYDAALSVHAAPDDVVIVAVDDASIAALGRWPWPRSTHAKLMDRLALMGARAVAIDVLFLEPDGQSSTGDGEFAAAIARGPPTVLPLAVEMPAFGRPLRSLLPIPVLAAAASGVGHVHLELDRDGVGRGVFLREGFGAPNYPHLMLALLERTPGERKPAMVGARHPDPAGAPAAVWVRDYQMLIPFLGPPGHFARVSYVDVLNGAIPPESLRGKLVLVGVTAQGTGDAYPTPRSGHGVAMPGVEISANVLQALRTGQWIRPLEPLATALLAVVPILLVACGFLWLSPRYSLILSSVAWLGTLGASVVLLRVADSWWPPVAPLAALLIMYPLWSWRRLEATQSYLDEELGRLSREHFPFTVPASAGPRVTPFADVVERRIAILREAVQRSRDARQLFSDTIKALPGATFLSDNEGRVVISNAAAARLFGHESGAAMEGSFVDGYLSARTGDPALGFVTLARLAPDTRESVLRPEGRNVLVRTAPFADSAGERAGTIIEITDISELRAAQREREDALRFLSHDMKSPASSLMSLAQLQSDPARALAPEPLSRRLELLAQRLLALVDGFVGMARAEAADPRAFEVFDLRDAIQDAYDEVWAVAHSRHIDIAAPSPGDGLFVHGDRSLLARALINLIGNALKFSAPHSRVVVRIRLIADEVTVEVEDSGPGIAEEARASLFQRFSRRVHRGDFDPGGAGLGLAFVRVICEKHGGRAWMENSSSGGAIFAIAMPLSSPGPST